MNKWINFSPKVEHEKKLEDNQKKDSLPLEAEFGIKAFERFLYNWDSPVTDRIDDRIRIQRKEERASTNLELNL